MKAFNSCGMPKNDEAFNWRYKALGIWHPTCRAFQKGFRKNWYEGNKEEHKANVQPKKNC